MFRETLRLEGTLCRCEVEIRPVCWDIESKDLGCPEMRPHYPEKNEKLLEGLCWDKALGSSPVLLYGEGTRGEPGRRARRHYSCPQVRW